MDIINFIAEDSGVGSIIRTGLRLNEPMSKLRVEVMATCVQSRLGAFTTHYHILKHNDRLGYAAENNTNDIKYLDALFRISDTKLTASINVRIDSEREKEKESGAFSVLKCLARDSEIRRIVSAATLAFKSQFQIVDEVLTYLVSDAILRGYTRVPPMVSLAFSTDKITYEVDFNPHPRNGYVSDLLNMTDAVLVGAVKNSILEIQAEHKKKEKESETFNVLGYIAHSHRLQEVIINSPYTEVFLKALKQITAEAVISKRLHISPEIDIEEDSAGPVCVIGSGPITKRLHLSVLLGVSNAVVFGALSRRIAEVRTQSGLKAASKQFEWLKTSIGTEADRDFFNIWTGQARSRVKTIVNAVPKTVPDSLGGILTSDRMHTVPILPKWDPKYPPDSLAAIRSVIEAAVPEVIRARAALEKVDLNDWEVKTFYPEFTFADRAVTTNKKHYFTDTPPQKEQVKMNELSIQDIALLTAVASTNQATPSIDKATIAHTVGSVSGVIDAVNKLRAEQEREKASNAAHYVIQLEDIANDKIEALKKELRNIRAREQALLESLKSVNAAQTIAATTANYLPLAKRLGLISPLVMAQLEDDQRELASITTPPDQAPAATTARKRNQRKPLTPKV